MFWSDTSTIGTLVNGHLELPALERTKPKPKWPGRLVGTIIGATLLGFATLLLLLKLM